MSYASRFLSFVVLPLLVALAVAAVIPARAQNTLAGNLLVQQSVRFSGDISDTLAADANDYAPANLATAAVLRVTATGAPRTITGLTGGADGRVLWIVNAGALNVILADESASSTAANRFALTGALTLPPDAAAQIVYDATSSRWRVASTVPAGSVDWAGITGKPTTFGGYGISDTSANLAASLTDETGSGAAVFANSPTLMTPNLGTPSAVTLTNATGLPVSTGIYGLGSGVAAALATPTSANVAAAVTDETGTGALVFASSPALAGVPTAPTAAADTNTTQIATTAFAKGEADAAQAHAVARANHTGTQLAATISDFSSAASAAAPVQSVAGRTGAVTLSTGDVSGLGTMATQNASAVAVTGGTVNGASVGATTPSTGAFTTLSSTVADGTYGTRIAGATGKLRFLGHSGGKGYIDSVNTAESAGQVLNLSGSSIELDISGVGNRATLSSTGLSIAPATASTSTTTGALVVPNGGVGIGGALHAGGNASLGTGSSDSYGVRMFGVGGTSFVGAGNSLGNPALQGWTTGFGAATTLSLNPAGGQVLVGAGGLAVTGSLSSTDTTTLVRVRASSAASVTGTYESNNTGGSGDRYHMVFRESGTERGSITSNGSATSYNTASDARLKTNVRDLTGSGAIVDALKPRVFDWKSGHAPNTAGFVAQEVHAVFPQAVTPGDSDPQTVSQQWAMDAAKLMPVVVAELKSLRARVAELEAQLAAQQPGANQKLP